MKFDLIFNYFMTFIQILTPIILAIISFRASKRQKEDKANNELQKKYDAKIAEERANNEKKRDESIQSIKQDMENLKTQVEKIEETIDMGKIEKSLSQLVDISSINMKYSQSLSGLVVTIGEAIKETSKDDNISKAIQAHQAIERDLMNKIYKAIY